MKIIGITGNYGKTSVCEILFGYLRYIGYDVGLSCSNGCYYNHEQRSHDFYIGMKNMDLDYFKDKVPEYLIVEILEENAYYGDFEVLEEYFEVIANASYGINLNTMHQQEYPDFGLVLPQTLKAAYKIIFEEDKNVYNIPNALTYNVFENVSTSFEGSTFIYKEAVYSTSLITTWALKNLACAVKIIETLDEFDAASFEEFISDFFIRGRFEKHIINNKKIIIDTSWHGIDDVATELSNGICQLNNSIIIFIPYKQTFDMLNDQQKQWRKNTGQFLKDNNIHTILTDAHSKYADVFKQAYGDTTGYTNYEYIADPREALVAAIQNTNSEYLLIAANEQYRKYRQIIEEIVGMEV